MRSIIGKTSLIALAATALITGAPRDAEAFCGFYVSPGDKPLTNDASMVALMRDGTRTVMSMSNNYKGPATDFAMVVPVPVVLQKENVKTLDKNVFKKLEELSAPRLVEYWEQDPCPKPYYGPYPTTMAKPSAKGAGSMADASVEKKKDYGVKIEAKFTVGEYDILILSAKQSDGLESWLHDNKYNIPQGASAALAPYIKEQQKFFVAKIDIKKVQMDKQGVAVLSPLRFSYESPDFRLPVRLGLLNAPKDGKVGGAVAPKQDLIVFTLSRSLRYDVANYPNVFIPTNLEVTNDTREKFTPMYAALFDEAVAKGNGKGIVTEYSWISNGCDPCPTPPLQDSDIATLGGDILFGMGAPPPPPPNPGGPMGKGPGMPMGKPMGFYGGSTPMVLTRLHARYDGSTLTDDLIFRAAEAVVGGREIAIDEKGALEKGAQPSSQNNFQARYIIRHPWKGPILCKDPQRGIWGGPPPGVTGDTQPKPATDLAQTARGNIKLATHLKAGMPDFQVKAASSVVPTMGTVEPPAGDPDAGTATTDDTGAAASDASFAPPGGTSTVPPVPPSNRGCGCELPGRLGGREGDVVALGLAASIVALGRGLSRKKRGPRA
jgi:hypothetical protein